MKKVAWIGRISPVKAPGLFVRLAERMKDDAVEFVMIGDGPMRDLVERMNNHANNVHFRGWITESDVVDTLTSGDIDLVVQTCFIETFGITNLQAMMAGVPLLTVGTAGVLDYIPQHSCVPGVEVLESFDPDVIARTVRRLLFDDTMEDCRGSSSTSSSSSAADLSSFWNEDRVGREYVRLYEWLMRG